MGAPKPAVTWVGSPNFTPGRKGQQPVAIVYHIMAGTLAGTDSWFRNPGSKVSAHFGIGRDGAIHQYVREEDTAWANGRVAAPTWSLLERFPKVNPNAYTLSIEHEGQPGEPFTEEMYEASLALTRYLLDRWSIPVDRDHLIGHHRIDGVNRAHCPGPSFPWDRLFADLSPPPAGDAGPFPDVSAADAAAEEIAWVRDQGLFRGRDDGLFHPDDPLTRRELAIVLKRLHDLLSG